MNWFRDRIKNQRPWFRVDTGVQSIEGFKMSDGTLEIYISNLGNKTQLKINRECAEKITGWMQRTYPNRGANVISMGPKLSLLESETDTGRSPEGPGR